MLEKFTKVKILGKRPRISVLKVFIGLYDDLGHVRIFGLGHEWPGVDSMLLVERWSLNLKRI